MKDCQNSKAMVLQINSDSLTALAALPIKEIIFLHGRKYFFCEPFQILIGENSL
jgi:hypothetical protein